MLIKIKRTFAQPGRAFHKDSVHEVEDTDAERLIELKLAEKAEAGEITETDDPRTIRQ